MLPRYLSQSSSPLSVDFVAEKIRGIIYSATRSHSRSGTRLVHFNRFRSFSPKHVAYLRTIECTHSRQKRYDLTDCVWMIEEKTNLCSLHRQYSSSFEDILLLYMYKRSLFHFVCSCLFFIAKIKWEKRMFLTSYIDRHL